MPIVTVPRQPRFRCAGQTGIVPKSESKIGIEEISSSEREGYILPLPAGFCYQRVHINTAMRPHSNPCTVTAPIEIEHQRIPCLGGIAGTAPQIAFTSPRKVVETQNYRVSFRKATEVDATRTECVASETADRSIGIKPSISANSIKCCHTHRGWQQACTRSH